MNVKKSDCHSQARIQVIKWEKCIDSCKGTAHVCLYSCDYLRVYVTDLLLLTHTCFCGLSASVTKDLTLCTRIP